MTTAENYKGRDSFVQTQKVFYDGDSKLAVLTSKLPILQLNRFDIDKTHYENLKKNYLNVKIGKTAPRLYAMTFVVDSETWGRVKSFQERGELCKANDIFDRAFPGNLQDLDADGPYIPRPNGLFGVLWATGNYRTAHFAADFVARNYNPALSPRENSVVMTDHILGIAVSDLETSIKKQEEGLKQITERNRKLFTDPK